MTSFWRASVFFLALISTGTVGAAETARTNAVLSYRDLDDLFQMTRQVDQAKLAVHVMVSSTNRAVPWTNITLTIQSTNGFVPIALTNGRIALFPHKKEFLAEDPPIVSNQSKGSLNLQIRFFVPLDNDLKFHYSRLADGVGEANRMIKVQAGIMSFLAPRVKSLTFYFPWKHATNALVSIDSAAGRKEFRANTNGMVKLLLDPALIRENPEVTLSEKAWAVPDLPFH